MKFLLRIAVIVLLAFGMRSLSVIEFSAAKFDISHVESKRAFIDYEDLFYQKAGVKNMVDAIFYRRNSVIPPYAFEDGLASFLPNYITLKQNLIDTFHNSYTTTIELEEGETLRSHKDSTDLCIIISKKEVKSWRKFLTTRYSVKYSGNLHVSYHDSPIHMNQTFESELQFSATGIYSKAYLDYKITELWLQSMKNLIPDEKKEEITIAKESYSIEINLE